MDEYYCPNCGATLNDQFGFDPSNGTWTCTSCGKLLMDDDVYEGDTFQGVAWYCDECGALLNRQSGFSDCYGSWTCTECGHRNGTTEEDIIDDSPKCPNCGAKLSSQFCYADWEDDWECTECGAHLHHNYSSDPYEVLEEENNDDSLRCPNCGDKLSSQLCYSEWEDDWECTECGAHLHHNYSSDPYEVVDDEDDEDVEIEEYEEEKNSGYENEPSNKKQSSYSTVSQSQNEKSEISESELRKQRVKAFLFKHKRIQLHFSYIDLLGKDINTVYTILHSQAFSNIKRVPIRDIYVGSSYSVGQVEQVVIQGSAFFNEGDLIPYDAEIIITYHLKKEISIPYNYKALRKMNYLAAGDELQKLGFTEIYEHPIKDLVTGWVKKDGSVERITVGGICPFARNSVFEYDTKITIEYHTFKFQK